MTLQKCFTWTTRLEKILDEVQPSDMVRFHRGLFIHYAVYVGRGRAIHHHLGTCNGEIIEVTLEYLAKGDLMKVVKVQDTAYSPEEIVTRARSRIGRLPYSLHRGNCEHFANWVYYGSYSSRQLYYLCPYQHRLLHLVQHNPKKKSKELSASLQGQSEELVENNGKHLISNGEQQNQSQFSHQEERIVQQESGQDETLEPGLTNGAKLQHKDYRNQNGSDVNSPSHHATDESSDEALPETAILHLEGDQHPSKRPDEPVANRAGTKSDTDSFEFIPPRPMKYRPAKNRSQLARNHLRSCLKVLAVQATVGLAAVTMYRCGLQADNLKHLSQKCKRSNRQQDRQNGTSGMSDVECTFVDAADD